MRLPLTIPTLEYALSHPYPHNRWFFFVSIAAVVITLPFLIIINFVTLGYEVIPTLQPQFKANNLTVPWGSTRLPRLLGVDSPPCNPIGLGRGDNFRVNASLFDYTVMSTWTRTKPIPESGVREQERVAYGGQPFANCKADSIQFDHSLSDSTHTVTVGVICNGTDEYPIYIAMQTTMVFSWLLNRDFIGQYYGQGVDPSSITEANRHNYRTQAFAVLGALSVDSLTIMRHDLLSNPAQSISSFFTITYADGKMVTEPISSDFMYLNGTRDQWPEEAAIYESTIYNLVNAAAHTVNLDLGSAGPENIYRNAGVVNDTFGPNRPPNNISSDNWAKGSQTFFAGLIPSQYDTWAEVIRAGQVVPLGEVNGLHDDTSMVTTYLCPTYERKQILPLLTAIFVGTATMLLSGWTVWMFGTAMLARYLEKPCVECKCRAELRSSNVEQGAIPVLCGTCGNNDLEKTNSVAMPVARPHHHLHDSTYSADPK